MFNFPRNAQQSGVTDIFGLPRRGQTHINQPHGGLKFGHKMFKKGSESVETRQSSGGSELKGTERI